MSDTPKKAQPDIPADLIRIVRPGTLNRDDTYIGEIAAKPYEQPHMSLGYFTPLSRLKGFAIEIIPDPDPENSIVAHVVAVGASKRYELVLHIANYGLKTINARVWQINAWPAQKEGG